jgi:hypothetical protein
MAQSPQPGSKPWPKNAGVDQSEEASEILGVTAERLNSGRGDVVHWTLPA